MSTSSSPYLKIKVSNQGRELETQSFSDVEIYIGRDPASGVFLDNPGVSRRHAKIQRTDAGLKIMDLQSGNGTFVNEEKVTNATLENGDVIRISKFTLELQFSDEYIFESQLVPHPTRDQTKPKTNPQAEVSGGGETVFLQPGEQAKVLQQAIQAERKSEQFTSQPDYLKEPKRMSQTLVFLGGIAFGVVVIWLFFG